MYTEKAKWAGRKHGQVLNRRLSFIIFMCVYILYEDFKLVPLPTVLDVCHHVFDFELSKLALFFALSHLLLLSKSDARQPF